MYYFVVVDIAIQAVLRTSSSAPSWLTSTPL